MYISVTDRNGVSYAFKYRGGKAQAESLADSAYLKKTARIYLIVTLFVFVFGQIYERFSHRVYSRGMFWGFLIPLLAGAALFGILSLLPARTYPDKTDVMFYNWGIAAFTAGSLFKGALEIYGTANTLTNVYWLAGGALAAFGALRWAARIFNTGKTL